MCSVCMYKVVLNLLLNTGYIFIVSKLYIFALYLCTTNNMNRLQILIYDILL